MFILIFAEAMAYGRKEISSKIIQHWSNAGGLSLTTISSEKVTLTT